MAKKDSKDAKASAKAEDTGGVKIRPNLEKYVKGKSASGKKTLRTDDTTARALEGLTPDEVYSVASKMLEVSVKDLQEKYGHLNWGQQRMNLGNRIRGVVARQDAAHEKDKTVATGGKLLEVACEKPHAARDKRIEAAEAARKKAEAEREKKAKEAEKAKEAKSNAA